MAVDVQEHRLDRIESDIAEIKQLLREMDQRLNARVNTLGEQINECRFEQRGSRFKRSFEQMVKRSEPIDMHKRSRTEIIQNWLLVGVFISYFTMLATYLGLIARMPN